MNKCQIITLWVIAIVLGVAVATVKLSQKDTTQSTTQRASGETLFESFPATEVASIHISGAAGTVTLHKKADKWLIAERDDYPANTSPVHDFLRTLSELKVTRSMEAGPSFAPRFGMDESSTKAEDRGLTVSFSDAAGKELAKISLGKNIESGADAGPMGGPMSVGRYIRNHADESGFYAISEMFPSVSEEAARWFNTDFISPEKIQSISMTSSTSKESNWKINRASEEAEFQLVDGAPDEVANTTQTGPLKSLFSYSRFDDVVAKDQIEKIAAPEGKRTAVITTFEGFTYTIPITPVKDSEEQFLLSVDVNAVLPKERNKASDENPEDATAKDQAFTERLKTLTDKLTKEQSLAGRTFKVSKTTIASLIKNRSELVTTATAPKTPTTVTTPPVAVP